MADELPAENQHYGGDSWGEDGFDVTDSGHQQDIHHSDQHTQDPDVSLSHASGEPNTNGAEDGYEPSLSAPPVLKKTPSPSSQATGKPKMSGGFLVGSSDDEDDEDATPIGSTAQGNTHNHPNPSPFQVSTSAQAQPDIVTTGAALVSPSKIRHPQDIIGSLEDRVKEDPRGDMDAWLALMAEYRRRTKFDDLRAVYNRFLEVFPQAAETWVQYIELELELNNLKEAEQLFSRSLMTVPNVQLWTVYLNYIRRRNDLSDPTGTARQTVQRSYEFVIDNIGVDKDSGKIWQDFIQFIRNGPGQIGGNSWQDQQKMDQLRKAYQRAVSVPISTVNNLWKEYDQFEMGLNKMTGRKFIQERSPAYMSAKGANIALENITRGLQRTTLPRLAPAPGFEGHQEYMEQVKLWKKWIAWEKEDPLVLQADEPEVFKQRILYCYKQALMALRFWPEMWVDAAEWCFENTLVKDGKDMGMEFLTQGIAANPASVLLALKHADRIESTYPIGDGDDAKIASGAAVRAPYDKVLDTLYEMSKKLKDREQTEVKRIEDAVGIEGATSQGNDDDDDIDRPSAEPKKSAKDGKVKAIKDGFAAQQTLLAQTISFVWIALARAMRRIQGKGTPGATVGGMRQVFMDARGRGKLTSDVYVAIALIESVVYKDPVGPKIFERGAKLFPEDANFMIEYLKYLHAKDDTTNARVVFETCVNRLTQKPETVNQAKPLYAYFHKYESQYGELSQIGKLEKRMAELFPEDKKLSHFSSRYSSEKFDPIAAPIIESPAVQMRPKAILPSIEQPLSLRNSPYPASREVASPRPPHLQAINSPKRPFPSDELEDRPRKLPRGESPLKGAAGRRLDQRRSQGALPRDITFLAGILPPAETYDSYRINPGAMIRLIQSTYVPDIGEWRQDQSRRGGGQQRQGSGASHGRQPSSDLTGYSSYSGRRDSPNPGTGPGQRPLSPYDGAGRRLGAAGGSGTYRNSPLAGSYETPPTSYRQDAQYPPPGPPGPPDGSSWPTPQAGGYVQPPPQQQYGRYPY